MLQIAKKNIFVYVERTKTSALYEGKKTDFSFRVMLTNALRGALVKDSKIETIAKFYVEKVTF
jgi:predicted GIY-YIG superfamily endonuclease